MKKIGADQVAVLSSDEARKTAAERIAVLADTVVEQIHPNNPGAPYFIDLTRGRNWVRQVKDERSSANSADLKKTREADVAKKQGDRLDAAYTRSVGFQIFGAIGFFPLVNVPPVVKDKTAGGDPVDPYAHAVRNYDVGASLRYNFTRFVLVQGRGGYRKVRVDSFEVTPFTSQYYLALDSAFFIPFTDKPDEKGFQSGVGVGVSATYYKCLADGGCKTALNITGYPEKAPLDWRTQFTAFAEVRLLKELQFRVGLEAFIEQVNGTIDGTAADVKSPTLRGIRPTLAVGSSFWGI